MVFRSCQLCLLAKTYKNPILLRVLVLLAKASKNPLLRKFNCLTLGVILFLPLFFKNCFKIWIICCPEQLHVRLIEFTCKILNSISINSTYQVINNSSVQQEEIETRNARVQYLVWFPIIFFLSVWFSYNDCLWFSYNDFLIGIFQ